MGGVGRARRHGVQQFPELLQRGDRHDRWADGQGRARRRVSHPRGQSPPRAVRQLAKQQRVAATLQAAIYPGNLTVEWVPAVVNGDGLRSLSRM